MAIRSLIAGAGIAFTENVPGETLEIAVDPAFVLNVKDYGALGDNSTDDAASIQSAIDAAEAIGGAVYFPRGTYLVGTMLVNDTGSVRLYGAGRRQSILKRKAAASIASVLHVGATAGTSTISNCEVSDLGFDGNSGCTDAVVKVRNVGYSRFVRLAVYTGSAVGFRTDTSTASVNTNLNFNLYDDIFSTAHTGIGIKFQGEKDAQYGILVSSSNGGDGIEFKGFKADANTLAETTECTAGQLTVTANTGSGVVFDQVEKYTVANIQSHHNSGYGVRFKSTLLATSGNGSNSGTIANIVSRNDSLGGIAALESDTAFVGSMQIGNALLIGFGSSLNAKGIHLQGVSGIAFGTVKVVGFPGDGVKIENGLPLNSAGDSANITFNNLRIDSNGHASATTNFGLTIIDSTSYVQIGTLYSANSNTSGSNYELNIGGSVGPLVISQAILVAATGGNEINNSSSAVAIGLLQARAGAGPVVAALRDGITAPSNNISGVAQIYVDTADGDLKVRFADGTVKTIVVDT